MYSNHRSRRCAAICQLLPTTETNLLGLSASELLSKLKDKYNGTDGACLRALQRDLKQLVEDELIVPSHQQGEGKHCAINAYNKKSLCLIIRIFVS